MKLSAIWASCVVAALFLGAGTAPAQASVIASDYIGGGIFSTFTNATGWWFTPTQNVNVYEIGVYDHGSDGFASSHDIGIFTAAGASVVTTTIGSGTSGTFVPGTVDGTRFVTVPVTMLLGGAQYYIVANNFSSDPYAFGPLAVTFDPLITWNGYGDGDSNSIFSTVTLIGGQPGNLGPNFRFSTVSAPEPGTLALFGLGLAGLGFVRRKRTA